MLQKYKKIIPALLGVILIAFILTGCSYGNTDNAFDNGYDIGL